MLKARDNSVSEKIRNEHISNVSYMLGEDRVLK